jgi:hypothetical protein
MTELLMVLIILNSLWLLPRCALLFVSLSSEKGNRWATRKVESMPPRIAKVFML